MPGYILLMADATGPSHASEVVSGSTVLPAIVQID